MKNILMEIIYEFNKLIDVLNILKHNDGNMNYKKEIQCLF